MENKISILDGIFLTLIVSFITLQPYFMHGAINFYETGFYLPCIDDVFRGKIPYRDIFILRGPLEVYLPAILMVFFGRHLSILNGYFYFGTVLTLVICVFMALNMYKTRLFIYLMVLVLVGKTFARVNFNNWGGIRFGLGMLAILFAVKYFKKEKPIWILIAGVLSSLGFFTSFEIGMFSVAAAMVSLFFYSVFKGWAKGRNAITIYVIGGFIVLVPILFYFLITGALVPFFDTVFKVYRNMVPTFSHPLRLGTPQNFYELLMTLNPFNRNIRYMGPFFIYVGIAIHLLRRFLKKSFETADFGVLCLSIYGALLYKSVFRNLEGPQFQMALQPVIILSFLFLENIYLKLRKSHLRLSRIFIAMVVLFSVSYSLQRYNHRFFIFKYKREFFVERRGVKILFPEADFAGLSIKRAKGVVVPKSQADEIENVVRYIQSRTKENEGIFTFPNLGTYNFLAQRPCLTRFSSIELAWISKDWHKEVMNELTLKRPRYVLAERNLSRYEPYMNTVGRYIEELKDHVDKHYRKEARFGNVDIWKLKE